ncbi:MAG: DNA-3-methyladenine glycosylase I [Verrucomicrobia bacterium]|nr:DNA-3-methyladenine glycosylase I [Verrucomicrobiota bacterium]
MKRCAWCGDDPLYVRYHDEEWGVPLRGDRELFEMLTLEGAQAGLSWITILRKRENYRRAFANFEPAVVAAFDERKQAELLLDPGIVRNRAKIAATIGNARAVLTLQAEGQTLTDFLWAFVDHRPIVQPRAEGERLPATSPESDAMSKALLRRGFKFVGSTICYAFMQATGMVNDHMAGCFRLAEARHSQ